MKKALVSSRLVTIIIVVITFFLMLSISSQFKDVALKKDFYQRQSCKQSAFILSKINEGSENYGGFNCETKIVPAEKVPNEDFDQKKLVADEMYSCWNIFGEGKFAPVFNNNFIRISWRNPNVDAKVATKCFICTQINLPDEGVDLNNFESFLKNNNPVGRENSYYQILDYDSNIRKDKFKIPNGIFKNSLKVVYAEGKGFYGVGVFDDKTYNEFCKGVVFGK